VVIEGLGHHPGERTDRVDLRAVVGGEQRDVGLAGALLAQILGPRDRVVLFHERG